MIDVGQTFARWTRETAERQADGEPIQPEPIEFTCRRTVRDGEGSATVVETGAISVTPAFKSRRPSRFRKLDLSPEEILDSLFAGEEAWAALPDEAIWEAARRFVADHDTRRPGRLLSHLGTLNVTLNVALAARAGLVIRPWQVRTH